jgi:hypothetical protein
MVLCVPGVIGICAKYRSFTILLTIIGAAIIKYYELVALPRIVQIKQELFLIAKVVRRKMMIDFLTAWTNSH